MSDTEESTVETQQPDSWLMVLMGLVVVLVGLYAMFGAIAGPTKLFTSGGLVGAVGFGLIYLGFGWGDWP